MGPEHWHVTLRFLGNAEMTPAVDALSRLSGVLGATAVVGPAALRLGREVLALPVEGLGSLAAAVDDAFAGLGRDPDHRPFHGHLTLARGRGSRACRSRDGRALGMARRVGQPRPQPPRRGGARYEDLAVVTLGPS